MKNFLAGATTAILLVVLIASVADVQAQQQSSGDNVLSAILTGLANGLAAEEDDKAIRRVFDDVLRREPSDTELRRYRQLMHEQHWDEDDIRRDLRDRGDYRSYSGGSTEDAERIVRRAYEDLLRREPSYDELRQYRDRILRDGWTEYRVREELRRHDDHAQWSRDSAERVVRRAYQDVLGREPDYNGLVMYRNHLMDHGWDEHDVREALLKSPEYRQRTQITSQEAFQIVRRAYRSVLNREPDDQGSRGYLDRVINDHWSEADVARELRNSDEYRNQHRRR